MGVVFYAKDVISELYELNRLIHFDLPGSSFSRKITKS